MKHPKEQLVAGRLVNIITDAFNRSISALADAGAIDTKKMQRHYTGIGSKYYDVVTEQIEVTVRTGAPWICELFTDDDNQSAKK